MKHNSAQLAAMAADGMSLSEIADEVGSTARAIRVALRRRGLRAVHETEQTLRAKVQTMRPHEAVEYLLGCLQQLAPALCGEAAHPIDAWGLHLQPRERRLLIALHDARGAMLSRDQAMAAVYFDAKGDLPGEKILDVFVCRIRAKLPAERARIITTWGQGWRMKVAE